MTNFFVGCLSAIEKEIEDDDELLELVTGLSDRIENDILLQ